MFLKRITQAAALSLVTALGASAGHGAELGGFDFTGSGFLTLVAGKMLTPADGKASDYKRPIFVSDYSQAGIYESTGGLQWKPDSKLGLQGMATFPDRRLSITGQVVSRGARDGNVNLEWLYASYKLNDNLKIQAGRKRIPMFYYSDIQDVGFALPWTHLPSGPYGWEAVNYNGVNLAYQDQWNGWSAAINLLAGSETKRDAGYWKVYRGKHSKTNIKWDDILGGDIVLSRDWFETRFVYIQSKMRQKDVSGSWDGAETPGATTYGLDPSGNTLPSDGYYSNGRQQIYGLAFNADYRNWLLRSEVLFIDHDPVFTLKDHAYLVGVGYRFGKWTPMVTVSEYRSQAILSVDAPSDAQEATRLTSFTVRYDLTTSSDIKFQFDYQKDRSGPNYTLGGSVPDNRYGNSRLITVAYDMVF